MWMFITTSSWAIFGQKKERKNIQKWSGSCLSTKGTGFSSILIIWRVVGGALGDAMFLHAIPVAEKKTCHLLAFDTHPPAPLFLAANPTRSSSISCLSHVFFSSAFLCLAFIASYSSVNRRDSALAVSFPFSVFPSNLTPSSTTFRATVNSSSTDFSLARSSSLSSMLWAMYTLIVLVASSRLKSIARCCIKLQTLATTWDGSKKLLRNQKTKAPIKEGKGLPLPSSRWLYNLT